jgi:putative transposase
MDALGHEIDASTIRRILRRHGIPPAPKRGRGRDNDILVVSEKPADVELDFAQTVIMDGGRICRLYLLLAIHTLTREAALVGITEHPDEAWMAQCARNLTMADVGFLDRTGARSVQMDGDTIFTARFRQMLTHPDREVKQTPPRQPWENGHIERFIQTPSPGICPLNPLIFDRRRKDSNSRSQCPARKIGDVGHAHEEVVIFSVFADTGNGLDQGK